MQVKCASFLEKESKAQESKLAFGLMSLRASPAPAFGIVVLKMIAAPIGTVETVR